MKTRMNVSQVAPEAYKAINGLGAYTRRHIDPVLHELVKVRASMVNGCAYCVHVHSHDALAAGETTERLFGLAAWHESWSFTEKERVALALTDAVTRLGPEGVPDAVWDAAAEQFGERELADLLVGIATINVLNRIAIPTRMQPA